MILSPHDGIIDNHGTIGSIQGVTGRFDWEMLCRGHLIVWHPTKSQIGMRLQRVVNVERDIYACDLSIAEEQLIGALLKRKHIVFPLQRIRHGSTVFLYFGTSDAFALRDKSKLHQLGVKDRSGRRQAKLSDKS